MFTFKKADGVYASGAGTPHFTLVLAHLQITLVKCLAGPQNQYSHKTKTQLRLTHKH